MAKWEAVIEGGGANLYQIQESRGVFEAIKVDVGLILNSHNAIGRGASLNDAIALIERHGGRKLKSIRQL